MGRTEQRFGIRFKAKERMPEEIEDAAKEKDTGANQRREIATGQRFRKAMTSRQVTRQGNGQETGCDKKTTVKQSVPGGKEGLDQLGQIVMRPAVDIDAQHKEGGKDGKPTVKTQAIGGQSGAHAWRRRQ